MPPFIYFNIYAHIHACLSSYPVPLYWQDRFIKYKKRSVTKNDKTLSDVSVGWYSKEDMAKQLKWNPTLWLNNSCTNLIQPLLRSDDPMLILTHGHACTCAYMDGHAKEEDSRCYQMLWSGCCQLGEARTIPNHQQANPFRYSFRKKVKQFSTNDKCICDSCLPWTSSRRCQYGGDDEYYIQVRESGNVQQEKIKTEQEEEITKETLHHPTPPFNVHNFQILLAMWLALQLNDPTSHRACQDDGPANLGPVDLGKIDAMAARDRAAGSAAVAATSEASHVHVHAFSFLRWILGLLWLIIFLWPFTTGRPRGRRTSSWSMSILSLPSVQRSGLWLVT